MLFVCLFDFCFKIYIPITTVTNKCVCWCNAQSFQSDENHSKAPLQNDDSLCFILSCNTWYIFITLETLTQVICLWLHLQPTILVFKELNIKMFAKQDEFLYTSMIFKIILWIIRAVSSQIEMDSLSLVKLWADLFRLISSRNPSTSQKYFYCNTYTSILHLSTQRE